MKVACLHFREPQDLQALGDVFYRATPQIIARGDRTLFLEISKSRHLYSEEKFVRRAKVTLARLGLAGRIGLAPDVPTALAFAVYGGLSVDRLPIEALSLYADPLLQAPETAKGVAHLISSLRALGFSTVGDFRQIPAAQLSSRFGSLGLLVCERVGGRMEVLWPAFVPTRKVEELHEFDLERPVDNLEPVFFVLRPLLERIFLRLRGTGRRARQFEVILKQEHPAAHSKQEYAVSVLLQLPYVSQKAIFQIAKERIEAQVRARPLEHRLVSVRATVLEEAPYFENQRDLFDQKKEENDESFYQLVSRLATKLGDGTVFFARTRESYLPEKNWKRVPEPADVENTESHVPPRPLRLLPAPLPVRMHGSRLVLPDGEEDVVSCDNVEILLSDWWEKIEEKTYFRVQTRSENRYWIYKSGEAFFLHGVFD